MVVSHKPKVSVIVPIYGVECFIERCARSLMEQTLENIEYIFVDDASKDGSLDILRRVLTDYPQRADCVQIIVHKSNAGLPAARNTGLRAASGDFVFHCDSDDFLELDALELLYQQAMNTDADIVWCDWFLTFATNERYMHEPSLDSSLGALKAMLGGGMKYNVWNKLVRRSIYEEFNIIFPAGRSMGEDMTMLLLFAHAEKVCHLSKALYHYVKMNTGAITNTISDKNYEALKYNVERISNALFDIYGNQLQQEIAFLKLEAKFPLLIMSSDWALYKLWQQWYPEANQYILKNKSVSLRSRLVQYCAWHKMYWVVWLHYQIVCRFIYGIIFK